MNIDERIERLKSRHLAGRIIRKTWRGGGKTLDGYERACLLASFSPEVEEAESPSACPADAMPRWLVHLTLHLDDNVSKEVWPSFVARYVVVLPKIIRLPAERLVRLDFETRAIAVRESRSHMTDLKALEAIDGVLVLLDRAAEGQEVSEEEWLSARSAARVAVETYSTPHAARVAGARAARVAAALTETDTGVAYDRAHAASWDRMANSMLSTWEKAGS